MTEDAAERSGAQRDDRPIGAIVGQIWEKAETLVRQEIELGLTELDRRTDRIEDDLKQAALGGAMALSGVLVLLAAIVLFLSQYMQPWLAALIVGAVVTASGYLTLKSGQRDIERHALDKESSEATHRNPQRFEGGTP